MKKRDIKFADCAAEYALKSNSERIRHGAVIVYRGKVISGGYNMYYTGINKHPERPHNSIHGEISAIVNTRNKSILYKCDLYVVRINAEGSMLSSKPCKQCVDIINKYNIKRILYT
jgi:deoxycytidylate deaminase